LGDFYGWTVITAFFLFTIGLCIAVLFGAPLLLGAALGLGVVGLYLPDLSLRATARRRQELFKLEMAFTLDRLAMFMASMPPERAIRLIAGRGGGLFVGELREAGYQMGAGKPTFEALETVLPRFPLPEFEEFMSAIKLSTETGTRLSTVLGAMSRTMQSDMEHDLLAKGTSSVLPMVLGMGLALFGILVVLGAPAIWLYLSSGTL
jgi:Flp pilus assembly protein TadB